MEYEYRIKSIPTKYVHEGHVLEEDYVQYITELATKGWRFVQLINLTSLSPNNRRIDLIFERRKMKGGE